MPEANEQYLESKVLKCTETPWLNDQFLEHLTHFPIEKFWLKLVGKVFENS